eukprot:jgi/Psemu1/22890/gm1.22890_g
MAGTRLMIQSLVLWTMVLMTVVSMRYGFCDRSTYAPGNLTKDFPRVPGYDPRTNGVGTTGRMVNSQWWEEPMCHPIRSVFRLLSEDADADADASNHKAADNEEEDSGMPSSPQSFRWIMTLAVENATILPDWIDVLTRELIGTEGTANANTNTALSAMLKTNQMALRILPPSSPAAEFDPKELAAKLGSVAKSTPDRPALVLYIPSHVLPPTHDSGDRYPEWKSFRTKRETSSTTVLVPSLRPSANPSTSDLKSLVEDWMARSMIQQQQQQQQQQQKRRDDKQRHLPPPTTRAIRLTREYMAEHIMAVFMPLLFPMAMPFFMSWIKEIKRYKQLTTKAKTKQP